MSLLRILFKWVFIPIVLFLLLSNSWIYFSTRSLVYDDSANLPDKEVVLVLGTSKRRASGEPNSFFSNRMNAVAELYHKGKVKKIIVSGDNEDKYYDEPADMEASLIELGVPQSVIIRDDLGLRTLDSVVRCKLVFGEDDIIIVTQEFHIFRALFIANFHGLTATGFTAATPGEGSLKVFFRELIARPLAVFDLYFLNMQPKHLDQP